MSDDEMRGFGQAIGRVLHGGEVIELVGDIGAGKTTLTKGIAMGLGVTEPVQSPTFTISRIYQTPNHVQLAHYDFYRLQDAGILSEEIAEMMQDERTVTVIEWAGAVDAVLPEDRLKIVITSTSETARQLDIVAGGSVSNRLKEELQL
ncbi:MAG TPA: tRNA (adenosine(37)-N6)-threonylcarbamoyltransferase complex ATPase subunit type 1 TsaE [Candidatus Saccharibacteria bacterium]|jgi:tRNA threonylcarbamoyladenosine biosynthesis protein TsaE|nr:tRNA (adenosine(37)-N6)-threonylcarbamoyltransferase complex ATPase subunit type 1 TsaE [Candidatus Saccharibacteria bacterium]HMR38422.1 tRNA (adenosine(37)-N6)-threonylcarbamoyltransferase complex ATPase subunit type 1 TsaE [Candidatus Saccharibacteria bacterium]